MGSRGGIGFFVFVSTLVVAAVAAYSYFWLHQIACRPNMDVLDYARKAIDSGVCKGRAGKTDGWPVAQGVVAVLTVAAIGVGAVRRRYWPMAWYALVLGVVLAIGPTIFIVVQNG